MASLGCGAGDELFGAAAANLTSFQEIQLCKHMLDSWHTQTNALHTWKTCVQEDNSASGLSLFNAGHQVSGGSSQHYYMETFVLCYTRIFRKWCFENTP